MIATMMTIAIIQPHIYATAFNHLNSAAIARGTEHVRVLGIELCSCREPLRALLPKNRPASPPRNDRRQVGLQHPAASSRVVEPRDDQDDEQSYRNPNGHHVGKCR